VGLAPVEDQRSRSGRFAFVAFESGAKRWAGGPANSRLSNALLPLCFPALAMKDKIHPKYQDAEIRCACGSVIKTRSTKPTILVGICNVCHPFYTGQQKFVDTAGRVDKFQQRMVKTQAAQAAHAASAGKKKKK
jgi:large subunit ribosomal protein L31